MSTPTPLRVLVVDDHPLYRDGLEAVLSTLPDVAVVGAAGDGQQAVELACALAPDVVLMDLNLPVLGGIEATARITKALPATAVLVLTMLDGDDALFAAMRSGARGYLLKGADREELARALTTVGRGEVVFSAALASRVLAWFSGGGTPGAAPFPELTDREREVLDLVARGLTNQAIAARLVVSDKTVRNHVSNVFAKLHVADRAAAVARARDAGLGQGPL
jgi:DNA-binding NarL/FixJ family response regulator